MNLVLELGGQRSEFGPGPTYVVGRAATADVVVSDVETKVSRHHLDISFQEGSWVAEDRSSGGSYLDDQPFQNLELKDGMQIRLGQAGGPILMVGLPTPPTPPAVQQSIAAAPPVLPQEAVVDPHATFILSDEALQLELDDVHHTFQPGQRVVVGRDADCNVRSEDRLVSGKHCAFEHDGSSWTIEDLGSTRGTFIDGRRVKKREIEGVFTARLGDSNAGAELRVVSKGTYKPKKDRGPLLLASLALAAVVVGGAAVALLWPDDDSDAQIAMLQERLEKQQQQTDEQIAQAQERAEVAIAEANEAGGAGNSPGQLAAARLATAFILVPDQDGEFISSGSGGLVSADGLILTNIHVVLPATFGERTQDPGFAGAFNPNEVLVGFPGTDGGPVDQFFIAEQVAAHPAHDAALIRVTEGLDGATLDDLPTHLPIGDSSGLLAGDEIAIIGYPGDALTDRVSVSLTNFQSFQPCVPNDDGRARRRLSSSLLAGLRGELDGGSLGWRVPPVNGTYSFAPAAALVPAQSETPKPAPSKPSPQAIDDRVVLPGVGTGPDAHRAVGVDLCPVFETGLSVGLPFGNAGDGRHVVWFGSRFPGADCRRRACRTAGPTDLAHLFHAKADGSVRLERHVGEDLAERCR